VFADHLTRAFGVEWGRDMGVTATPPGRSHGAGELVAEFSSRSRQIDEEKNRLIAEYVARTAGNRRGDDHQAPRAGHVDHPTGEAGPFLADLTASGGTGVAPAR
jgi:hypothetical protein